MPADTIGKTHTYVHAWPTGWRDLGETTWWERIAKHFSCGTMRIVKRSKVSGAGVAASPSGYDGVKK